MYHPWNPRNINLLAWVPDREDRCLFSMSMTEFCPLLPDLPIFPHSLQSTIRPCFRDHAEGGTQHGSGTIASRRCNYRCYLLTQHGSGTIASRRCNYLCYLLTEHGSGTIASRRCNYRCYLALVRGVSEF